MCLCVFAVCMCLCLSICVYAVAGAELESLCREAALLALREDIHAGTVTSAHFAAVLPAK